MMADNEQLIAACGKFEGIAPSLLNKLNPTVTGANTVQIDTGECLADGHGYKNSAAVSKNIPSAVGGGNTRIDRIVLRCSWAGFASRITVISGVDAGSPTVPAIVQTPGTTYDIKIAQVLVNTTGTCVVTDERVMAAQLIARQGGSATDFDNPGTTNYIPTNTKMQLGSIQWSGGAATSGTVSVTFPVAFSALPVIYPVANIAAGVCTYITFKDATHFTIGWIDVLGNTHTTVNLSWLAIGPA
jgi:hypothetical protein